jgi:hypothetical protein
VDAIRPLFEALIAEFGKPGASFNMKQQLIEGDYAHVLRTATTADNVYEVATDTFVVRDGKIVAQSFTAEIRPKSEKRGIIHWQERQQIAKRSTNMIKMVGSVHEQDSS